MQPNIKQASSRIITESHEGAQGESHYTVSQRRMYLLSYAA